MFLAKLTMIHGDELIERATVRDLTSRLIQLYRSTSVGKWHLVHLMADGLEKICETLRWAQTPAVSQRNHDITAFNPHMSSDIPATGDPMFSGDPTLSMDTNFLLDYNMSLGASQLLYLSNGTLDLNDPSPSFI